MEHSLPSQSAHWPLERLIARLSQQPSVAGLLAVGSLVDAEISSSSDYDLVIIADDIPAPWCTGITRVEDRLADLIFVSSNEVDKIGTLDAPLPPSHPQAPVMRWLMQGKILFDRNGSLERFQTKLQGNEWDEPLNERAAYDAWHAINFNLTHAIRLSGSDDPLYQAALTIRMAVYGHADLWFGYFGVRSIPWRGDKAAVQYLQSNDSAFLDMYQKFILASDRSHKLQYYRQAAALAAEPLGGLWTSDITVMIMPQMLAVWQNWMAGAAGGDSG
jgi:hypothetical protein